MNTDSQADNSTNQIWTKILSSLIMILFFLLSSLINFLVIHYIKTLSYCVDIVMLCSYYVVTVHLNHESFYVFISTHNISNLIIEGLHNMHILLIISLNAIFTIQIYLFGGKVCIHWFCLCKSDVTVGKFLKVICWIVISKIKSTITMNISYYIMNTVVKARSANSLLYSKLILQEDSSSGLIIES